MRVLLTADTVGGVWTYALELAEGLAARDVDVAIAAMGERLRPEQRADAAASPARIFAADYALEWMESPWADVERAGAWLLDVAATVEPDVVHLNGFVHAALDWRRPTLVVGHSDVLSWFEAVRGQAPPPAWDRYAAEVRRGIHAADVLAAPTQAMLGALERLYEPRCPTYVIPNGRAAHRFPPLDEQPFVLTAGRLWDEAKNVAALDRVADRLDWPVLAAGDPRGPDGAWAQPRALRLLGPLDTPRLARYLGSASIFALPARYEPFGLGPLEAALAGCALVLGDIPSLREVWGDAAVFVDPGDDDALAATLQHLIGRGLDRRALADRARARALELTPERMTEEYLVLYEQLLAEEATQIPALERIA